MSCHYVGGTVFSAVGLDEVIWVEEKYEDEALVSTSFITLD